MRESEINELENKEITGMFSKVIWSLYSSQMIIMQNICLYNLGISMFECMYLSPPEINKKVKNNLKEHTGYEQIFQMKGNIWNG